MGWKNKKLAKSKLIYGFKLNLEFLQPSLLHKRAPTSHNQAPINLIDAHNQAQN